MKLSGGELTLMFLSLGVLLAVARVLGEIAQRFRQPAVVGELLAGVLLGPTVLGALAPELNAALFPTQGNVAIVLDGLTGLAIALFLLVAGMEVELHTIWTQGRSALVIGVAGIVIPFALALGVAWPAPYLLGCERDANPTVFALFFATALSISALPVIAKTLMDLNLYKSDLGMIVIAAAVFNDLIGWLIFAMILGSLSTPEQQSHGMHPSITILLTLLFAGLMLTVVRWGIHRILPWLQAHVSWPGGVLGFAFALALLCAAFTEWIGIHAIFGSFLVGVAIGDSHHLREQTRLTILHFVSFIFAPLFFASIGLRVNFVAQFDLVLVALVLTIACAGKILGCGLAARWAGMDWNTSWALGMAMNARGAMEIILGLLALNNGIIRQRMFVALVVMAIVTSMMSGPGIQRLTGLTKKKLFSDYIGPKRFVPRLAAHERHAAIRELAELAAKDTGLSAEAIASAASEREQQGSTGMGNGIAVPHARLAGLTAPILAAGVSQGGVDFDAADGQPSRLVFLILTPADDHAPQLDILAQIARTFRPEIVERALGAAGYTEFLATIKTEAG